MDDTKLRRIERELEQTRNALHWQTKRCNHLVAALTLKLEQRDADVLATRHERETQLAQIMRALLVLEARLRREQRSIRAQLGSRDALIREQQLEIERLKKMIEPQRPVSPPESFRNDPAEECDVSVKPDLISSLGIWQQTNNKPSKTAQTSNGEQHLEEWQPVNPSTNLVASKPPEHHLEESLGIWPNKPIKTPHTSKGHQHLEERQQQPNNLSTNLEPSKTKSPNLKEFTSRRTEEISKMPEHHLQEFRSRRTEGTSIAEEHHLEELTNHDYREPLVSNGGSTNPENPLTTDVTNTTKFDHDEPSVTNGGSTKLGNPVITEASNTTKYVPINDSSGDVGSSKFRPKSLSANDCSTEDVGTKGVGTNKYRQKGLLINGDLEDLTTKYRQKRLKVNGGGENSSSNNVKYMQKGLVLDGVVNDVTTTSYRPKRFEAEDVPKVTSPRQRKMLMNGGGGTETSLERTPSSSSSSSTLSSTLSSLSSASSVSLLSSSSSILKPSSFDDEEDDGLVDNSRGGAAVERSVSMGKKEEKTVKISDIIQVRTHSDDLSECESSDSFTIIHDMKKVAEYRNGDADVEVNNMKTLPSALLHEMQVQSKTGRNEYHDNPVLECVNQILLRDQEEFLEEQRVLRMRESEKNQSQDNLNLVGRSSSRDDLTRLDQDKNLVVSRRMLQTTYNDKPPCLVTSSQLSLIGSVSFDEELNAVDVSSREQKSKQLKSVGKRSLIPPALPPKPLKLLSMRSPDFEASQQNMKSKISPQSKLPQKYDLDMRLLDNQPSCHPIIIGNASPALPEPNPDSELYVISNSALDDDLVQQIQGRNKKCGKELKNVLHPEQKGMNLTHALIHFPAGKNCSSGGKEVVGVSPSKFEDKRKTTPVKNNGIPVIKVASPVSTLLATSSVEGKGGSVEEEVVPSVSQMVKRFEHLSEEKLEGDGNTALMDDGNSALRDNFEEFSLDDMDVICGVTAEEDNENKEPEKCLSGSVDTTTASVTVTPSEAGVSYENFLEATGLSQKSIMTPSRIFSNNHRNVLKPKDVKHRSRVKAANTISNPTVRYWTEPFL